MNSNQEPNNRNYAADDEIDLRELFRVIWQGKWIIIAITFVFAVGSVFYALSLPNIYKSEVTLSPAGEDAGGMRLSGQLGGLASLAGVNLGGTGVSNKTQLALAVLESKQFKMDFIERRGILPELMAAEDWTLTSNTLVYDDEVYDDESKTWKREVDPPKQPQPSLQEAVKKFNGILSSSQDDETGLVTISIEHVSPYIAKQWVDWITLDLNENMRAREKEESAKSIAYLEDQLGKTQLADVKQVLFELIEEQTKTYMFTEVRDEYIFKTIDPAIVPEEKAKPSRAVLCIVGVLLGGFIGIGVTLVMPWISNLKSKELTDTKNA